MKALDLPTISDKDIDWVVQEMGLHPLDGARRSFLSSTKTLDVSACPGSGKTTLVVAKLAILARSWTSRTQGVCVLSHTNVAREEIQHRLGNTDVGERLLRYPHFIDTIHGFVNRFLAIPWLLSNGHQLTAIDDEITTRARIRNLGRDYFRVKAFLDKRRIAVEHLRLTSTDFSQPLANWKINISNQSATHRSLTSALRLTAGQGYFCFDEMFAFAEALLAENPEVAATLRHRFPFVLIDEMQDTSARQLDVLRKIFPPDEVETSVQRVGDVNQAIFEGEASSDEGFPDEARPSVDISDSFRFDASIASLASSLAVVPVQPNGLRGIATPTAELPYGRHKIFVFPDGDVSNVLPSYAHHVLQILKPEHVASSKIAAVGEVHQPRPDVRPGDSKYPNTICHYWSEYSPAASRRSYQPDRLIDYLRIGRAQIRATGIAKPGVDQAAIGMARLVNRCSPQPVFRLQSRPNRSLERQLVDRVAARDIYRSVLTRFVLGDEDITAAAWAALVPHLRAFIIECSAAAEVNTDDGFLSWVKSPARPDGLVGPHNRLVIETDAGTAQIDVSSIHAVKGETHAATLLLETFNHEHVLKSLMPWLVGDRLDTNGCSERLKKRMRAAYVAMSRPQHVLCLGLPRSSLGTSSEYERNIARLAERGWTIEPIA